MKAERKRWSEKQTERDRPTLEQASSTHKERSERLSDSLRERIKTYVQRKR